MKQITRRTTIKTIAASAVLAPLPVTASTDGKVAALIAEYHRLGDEAQAAEARAEDLLFAMPDDVRRPRITLTEPLAPGLSGSYAYSPDDVNDHFAANMRRVQAEGTPASFTYWAAYRGPKECRARFDPPTPATCEKHGDEAKRLFMDHMDQKRAEKMAEMAQAEAASKSAKDKAGVTQAEAKAQALWGRQDEALRQITETPCGGPRDVLAKLSLIELDGQDDPVTINDQALLSLRRDFQTA